MTLILPKPITNDARRAAAKAVNHECRLCPNRESTGLRAPTCKLHHLPVEWVNECD